MNKDQWIIPDWPAPDHIFAISSTRNGGISEGPYASLNVGDNADHIADPKENVAENRARFRAQFPNDPHWLEQVHEANIVDLSRPHSTRADASFTRTPNQVSVIVTADCLPVLFTDKKGSVVAAVHGGWRSLAAGILENTVKALGVPPHDLLTWLGPAIGPNHFQVGRDVYNAFSSLPEAFKPDSEPGKWKANLFTIARTQLNRLGVGEVFGGNFCTYSDPERFYSFRRDQGKTGRMATAICIKA